MLNNILNLDGVTVLNKKQQGSVNGGQACLFTLIYHGGGSRRVMTGDYSEGSAGSSEANSDCAALVSGNNDVGRCFYDCSHDGFGQ